MIDEKNNEIRCMMKGVLCTKLTARGHILSLGGSRKKGEQSEMFDHRRTGPIRKELNHASLGPEMP